MFYFKKKKKKKTKPLVDYHVFLICVLHYISYRDKTRSALTITTEKLEQMNFNCERTVWSRVGKMQVIEGIMETDQES